MAWVGLIYAGNVKMNISQAAKFTGLTSKTIRFYEEKGIIPKARRADNGYRFYTEDQLETLGFIKRARGLGFSLDECKQLLDLQHNPDRASAEVKEKVQENLARVQDQIEHLEGIKSSLMKMSKSCPGNKGHECPILDELCHEAPGEILQ
jgi:MerR family copper efflux transcriptional regulator